MEKQYLVPGRECTSEITITKSKFISTVRRIQSLAEMRDFYSELGSKHPKANHNCWATVAGAPNDSIGYGFSDDGEPNGTAGKPMFKVLQYSGKGQIGVVVTRYYGGVKLGTGGLVRAYTEAIQSVLERAEFKKYSPSVSLVCTFPYESEGSFRYVLDQHSTQSVEFEYSHNVTVYLTLDEAEFTFFKKNVQKKIGHLLQLVISDSQGV